MATKQGRGTKRACQNAECGSRFYDLERNPVICPICGSGYVIPSGPIAATPLAVAQGRKANRAADFAVEPTVVPEEAPEVESTAALAEVEAGEEAVVAAEEDETFLEEVEEDSGDVSGILGGTVQKDEKES